MAETSNPMMNRIQDIGSQVGQATANAVEGVKSAADSFGNRANEFVSDATRRAQEAGTYFNEKADEATRAVGGQFRSAGDASEQFGQGLRDTGDYLQQKGLEGICCDMANVIKRNPLVSLLAGICVGFCVGRTFSNRG